MKKFKLLIISLLLLSFSGSDFFQTTLETTDGKLFSFSSLRNGKATAIIFLLTDCPASQEYTLTLNQLSKKYLKEGVDFIGVFPGKYSTDEEMMNFRRDYKIEFTLLKDPEMVLAKKLHATIAPECFVINASGSTVYNGRIDDWLVALGKKRQVITEHNLADAIECVVKGRQVKKKEVKATGCILEYD